MNQHDKIHIALNQPRGAKGGSFQFLEAVGRSFEQAGQLAARPEDADLVLFSAFQNIPAVMKLRRALGSALFVHRIDGPIRLYNNWSDRRDDVVEKANRFLADATIFQSEWSRAENRRLGLPPSPYEVIITNAPDPALFNRQGKTPFRQTGRTRLVAVSWSANWKKGFKTYQWLDEHLDFSTHEMTFIGNSPVAFKNIRHLPPMKSAELADELRRHDVSIFASEFEACSNTLLEALHCGLPVIAKNATSNPEVLGGGGALFDRPEEIPGLVARVAADYEAVQGRIKVATMAEVAGRYSAFMQHLRAEKAAGRCTPKRLTAISTLRLEASLLRWKVQTRTSAWGAKMRRRGKG